MTLNLKKQGRSMATEHFDVVIVGAGLSGVGAGYHLQDRCPGPQLRDPRRAREHGRHPRPVPLPGHPLGLGHVHTPGYSFRPWTNAKAIADGPSILKYVKDTAAHYGIDKHIRGRDAR